MIAHPDFLLAGDEWAPPTPSPGQSTVAPSASSVQTVSPSLTQMPTTGPSDAATVSAALGLGVLLLGSIIVAAVHLRRRRLQAG